MVKFILLSVFSVLLVANKGICDDRITISQLLSFVDRIAVNLKQTRESIPTPNNLKRFKFQNVYETPTARGHFDSLPQSVKDLLKLFTPGTTTMLTTSTLSTSESTTPSSSPSKSTSSESTGPSSITSSPSEAPTTPTKQTIPTKPTQSTPPTKPSRPTKPTDEPSSPPTESSTASSTSASSSSATDTTLLTVSPTDSPATLTTEKTSSSTSSVETTISTVSRSGTEAHTEATIDTDPTTNTPRPQETPNIVNNDESSDNFKIDTSNLAEWFRKDEEAARRKSKFHVKRNKTDQDKITEVLNDFTRLANKWGIGFSLYKIKLTIFETLLVNSFPSNFLERLKARLLAQPVQIAKRHIVKQTKAIITKAKKYRTEIKDTQTLDKIIVLLEAVTKLPDLVIKSLIG